MVSFLLYIAVFSKDGLFDLFGYGGFGCRLRKSTSLEWHNHGGVHNAHFSQQVWSRRAPS